MTSTTATSSKSTKAILIQLPKRKKGATLDDIMGAIGWKRHSGRVAISGLRKSGYTIDLEQSPKGNRYRIATEPVQ